MINRKEVYQKNILSSIPKLLTLFDRDSCSLTYGSFDRQHWAWANKEFANVDFQRGIYVLVLLFVKEFSKNIYYKNKYVLKCILSGFRYWVYLQNKNGSFNQWYAYENSVGSTGFTLCSLTEAFLLVQEEIPNVQKESLLSAFDKAADFICLQRESHGFISNHLAGIALGLLNAAAILNNKKYLNKSNEIIEKILKHQSKEGWYREYEGADPGYETLGISYLAKYWKSTHSAELLKSLEKSLNYLIYFVHPDGTLGGEYGSRNTELYYPSGIEALSDYLPQSEYIANKMIIGIKEERLSLPLTTDIFNFIPLLISYVEAYNELNHNVSKSSGNIKLNNFKYFDESKIAVWTNDKHKIIIGISKGGIIRCYKNNGNMLYSDCGYVARLENGSKISSQFIDYNIDCNVTSRGCKLERYFSYVSEHQMSPTTFILFEIFMLLAGRYIKIGNWIKNLLANRLIRYKKTAPLSIVRSIKIFETKLVIEDHLKIKKKNIIKELIRKSKFSTIFMGSSRYFNPQELFQDDERIDGQELKFLNGQRFIKLVKEVTLD